MTTTPLSQMLAEALHEAGFGFDRPGGYAAQAAALLATPALARWVADAELGAAWREAEEALPEGWVWQLDGNKAGGTSRAWAGAGIWSTPYPEVSQITGPTPALALRKLAVLLRAFRGSPDR